MYQRFPPVKLSKNLVNPRVVSNSICREPFAKPNQRGMSELVTFFGQFLDHTITETEHSKTKWPIEVPANDPVFKGGSIPLFRTVKVKDHSGRFEAPMNKLASFIDASSVYGSSEDISNKLRLHKGGRLRLNNNFLRRDEDGFFISGDDRVNENPPLIVMHTLFAREHNRVAAEVARAYRKHSDDFIYALTRLIVAAELQAIVYYEFIPAVLGRKLPRYRGYRKDVIGASTVEFTTVGFRVGHTLVNSFVTSISNKNRVRRRRLSQTFFKPNVFIEDTMEGLLRGMTRTKAAEIDNGVVSELRNALTSATSPIKLDLVALNLQRARDHGIPSYNVLRKRFGMHRAKYFSHITRNRVLQKRLKNTFGTVDKVDAWAGGICESHVYGSLGPLFARIWIDQFMRLRDGDRFYFEKSGVFSKYELRSIPTLKLLLGKRNRLGKIMHLIIRRNTRLSRRDVPRNPFFV